MGVLANTNAETELADDAGNLISTSEFFPMPWTGRAAQGIGLQADRPGAWTASEIELRD